MGFEAREVPVAGMASMRRGFFECTVPPSLCCPYTILTVVPIQGPSSSLKTGALNPIELQSKFLAGGYIGEYHRGY